MIIGKKHQDGEVKIKRIFALIPHFCQDNTWRWLEWMEKRKKYMGGCGWLLPKFYPIEKEPF